MADDVVGSVHVEVHGDTDPLKNDIRQAASEIKQTVDTEVNSSVGTGITDNIVDQVADAAKPAEKEAKKVGRAIVRGIAVGAKDSRADMDRVGTELGESFYEATSRPMSRIRDMFRRALDDETGAIQIGPDLTGAKGAIEKLLPGDAEGKKSGRAVAGGMKLGILQSAVEKVFLGIALKAAMFGPILGGAIRAAGPLIIGLTNQIAVLGTALGGLGAVGGAAFATMIPGVAALKLAFTGMDKEAAKALKAKLADAAGDLAGFKERVRNEVVPALVDAVKTISQLAPEINKLGTEAGKAGGKIAKAFAGMLVGRKDEISNIFGNSTVIMEKFGKIGVSAVDVIINALNKLQPLVMQVVGSIERGMQGLTESMNESIDSGKFASTMQTWLDRGKLVLEILKNLGSAVGEFLGAGADASDDFLVSFEELTQKWADWTKSVEGQNSIKKMFDEAKPVMEEVWGLLGDIGSLFKESFTGDTGDLVGFIQSIREDVIPGLVRLQEVIRDSGLQDALYELADAVLSLFESGGGVALEAFVSTLTVLVDVLANLTDALGPIIPMLVTFGGTMKALTIGKAAFSGLFTLPSMFTALAGPIGKATTATEDLAGSAGEAGEEVTDSMGKAQEATESLTGAAGSVGDALDPDGKSKGVTKFKNIIAKVGPAVGAVGAAYGALSTVISATTPKFDDSAEHIQKLVDTAVKGSASLKEVGEGIGPNFWEKFMFSHETEARDFAGEIESDMGMAGGALSDFRVLWKNAWAGIGLDWGGVEGTMEGVRARLGAVQTSVGQTGDWQAGEKAINELRQALEDAGADAGKFQAEFDNAMHSVTEAKANAEVKIDFRGDFSNLKTGLASFTSAFSDDVQTQLDALLDNPAFRDPSTGGLTEVGMEMRAKIITEVDMTSLNGVNNAITDSVAEEIRKAYIEPAYLDQYGNLNEKGLEVVVKLIAEDQANPETIERIKKQAARMAALVSIEVDLVIGEVPTPEEWEKAGRAAIKLYVPEASLKELNEDIEGRFGREIIRIRTALSDEGYTEEQINALMPEKGAELLVRLKTEDAEKDLETLLGPQWEIVFGAQARELGPGSLVEVNNQLLKITEDGKWEAVIGATAEEAALDETEGKFHQLVRDEGTGEWKAIITVDDDGTAARTQARIEEAALDQTAIIHVEAVFGDKTRGHWNPQLGAWMPGPGPEQSMILPPSEPSTISPGGPTTMGFSDSFTPFGRQRAGSTDSSVVGRPNFWMGKEEEKTRNITINNYYPEPERASETVAMNLRVARYS